VKDATLPASAAIQDLSTAKHAKMSQVSFTTFTTTNAFKYVLQNFSEMPPATLVSVVIQDVTCALEQATAHAPPAKRTPAMSIIFLFWEPLNALIAVSTVLTPTPPALHAFFVIPTAKLVSITPKNASLVD
jgi:hypothetical protein